MREAMPIRIAVVAAALTLGAPLAHAAGNLDKISHILVIYLENRSFDRLFGEFPDVSGLASSASHIPQVPIQGLPYHLRMPKTFTGTYATAACRQSPSTSRPAMSTSTPNFLAADREVDRVVRMMQNSRMRDTFVIILTYDEFGGFFDHVAPPMDAAAGARADYFGRGTRIPAIIVSLLLNQRGKPDSTEFDTTSIAKFIADRHGLEALPQPRFDAVNSLSRLF